MVYTNHQLIDKDNKDLGLGGRCKIPYSSERLLIDFMTFEFRLIRTEIYNKIGGIDLEISHVQDYDMCLKISEVTEIYHHPESLYYYRVHPKMISQIEKNIVTLNAAQAIRNALERRGLNNLYKLNVNDKSQFRLMYK
jgi:GT2 family glycosyltransferase